MLINCRFAGTKRAGTAMSLHSGARTLVRGDRKECYGRQRAWDSQGITIMSPI